MKTLNVLMLMAAALSLDYSVAQDTFSGQVTELHTRKDLVKFLLDYIDADEAKVNQIKKWVNTLNILSEGSQDLYPPINAFKLMKKLNTDWGELESLLLESLVLQDMSHVTAHCHRENDGSNGMQSASANALHQFAFMIKCEAEGNSIFTAVKYINYGCYCGKGGAGTPVDELDTCCQVHDDCYGKVQVDPNCSTWYWQKAVPYFKPYHYTCDKESKKVTCLKKNDECEMVLCECDRAAAECFAKTPHNPNNVGMDQSRCK